MAFSDNCDSSLAHSKSLSKCRELTGANTDAATRCRQGGSSKASRWPVWRAVCALAGQPEFAQSVVVRRYVSQLVQNWCRILRVQLASVLRASSLDRRLPEILFRKEKILNTNRLTHVGSWGTTVRSDTDDYTLPQIFNTRLYEVKDVVVMSRSHHLTACRSGNFQDPSSSSFLG